tara:strand:+ start:345 stop:641 length:297 start_codon:yes stop_codon:yes gene_type:complete
MDLSGALAIIQGLIALVLALFGWYGQRQLARIDSNSERLVKLESQGEIFEIRLEAAATGDQIRSIIREELDRAMAAIVKDTEDIKDRVKALEINKPFG